MAKIGFFIGFKVQFHGKRWEWGSQNPDRMMKCLRRLARLLEERILPQGAGF